MYQEAIVIDAHNDLVTRVLDESYDADRENPAGSGAGYGHSDLPRLARCGLTVQWMASWVDAPYAARPGESFARAMRGVRWLAEWTARHGEVLLLATSAAHVPLARRTGRLAIMLTVEGGHAIENSLVRLHELYESGVRSLTLTWNNGNEWAGSAAGQDGTRTGGLTPFGRSVVREMNSLGMIVDVSHASPQTVTDVLETSSQPVVASHSCARALCDHSRNLYDDQLRAIAQSGGVIGVNFYSKFLDSAFDTDGATSLRQLGDHIEHIATVAGAAHVGLGSDFDGMRAPPLTLDDVTCLPVVAEHLLERGTSEADVIAVLGGNFLRVMQAVLKD